jgi:hypothetical protein
LGEFKLFPALPDDFADFEWFHCFSCYRSVRIQEFSRKINVLLPFGNNH